MWSDWFYKRLQLHSCCDRLSVMIKNNEPWMKLVFRKENNKNTSNEPELVLRNDQESVELDGQ